MSQILGSGNGSGGSTVRYLAGNTGGNVGPTAGGVINVVGSGAVAIAGNAGTNTLTVTVSSAVPTSFATDSGTATPSGNVITFHGAGGLSTSGSGSTVTITASGGGFTWNDVTGGSATMAAENGYIADKNTLTTLTLPTNNALGDTIKVVGKGSGGWTIVYTTGQNIIFGSSTTTTTSGSLSSTNTNDCIELVCTTASASAPIFTVVSSIGNLTVA